MLSVVGVPGLYSASSVCVRHPAEIIYQGGRGEGGEGGETSYAWTDIQTLLQLDAFRFAEFAKYFNSKSGQTG